MNPAHHGTKAGVHYRVEIPARGSARFRLRLARGMLSDPFADFDEVLEQRRAEADEFYAELQAGSTIRTLGASSARPSPA